MKKTFKIVMIPTEKESQIQQWGKWLFDCADGVKSNREPKAINQHLYILSDDKIKEGDWFIWGNSIQLANSKAKKAILV